MAIQFERTRDYLKQFDFHKLFVEELGWSQPTSRKPVAFTVKESSFIRRTIAELAGVVVLEIEAGDGKIPDAKLRLAVHKEVSKHHHENLLIFVDPERTQSLWYWVKRQNGKLHPRDHLYLKGQPGDLFISKLGQIVFDLADFDSEGNVGVVEVAGRLRAALDVERVTKRFYGEFQEQHGAFLELITGIPDERQRRWYASVLLNRLMFIYFLQKKGFLDGGDLTYLRGKLERSKQGGKDRYFREFLKPLFFEGFAKPSENRAPGVNVLIGSIKYLNGGLFLPHRVELDNPEIDAPDRAFENLFNLFDCYSWNLDDTPGGKDDEINPDVLGYIFEKYINQKAFGAYYTRTEITEYLCERTIHRLILDAINTPDAARQHAIVGVKLRKYDSLGDLLIDLDADLCRRLLLDVLPKLSLLDPACGSGAFLVAAMKTLINVYSAVIGKIRFVNDRTLSQWLKEVERAHASVPYYIKKSIITDNLFGVDVMEEATEIARLRLFLALVASAQTVADLEPLPNIDFNILAGNSLIGLMRVDDKQFDSHKQKTLFRQSYKELLLEKERLVRDYRHASAYADDLAAMRDGIQARKEDAIATLNELLLEEFRSLGVRYEEAAWDEAAGEPGRPVKRPLTHADLSRLHPFHWGYEFDEVLNRRGGFDAILTNPPWEAFKPNAKEFFEDYSQLVSKKKMTIHDFEREQAKLLRDPDIRSAWLEYLNQFPHQSAYFRSSPNFKNQISLVNGKRAGTDVNLYKLFVEQCFNLLRPGGRCGIITPGGVYTDLGTKQLREMLFSESEVDTLFGLSNERFLFEGVDHRQKICLLVFGKQGETESFTAAFRINPREAVAPEALDRFLHTEEEHLDIPVALVRKLSPDSLSVMEFKNDVDVRIAEKMSRFPLLGDHKDDRWNFRLYNEFHMTGDSALFKRSPGRGSLPLYEGKMIHQFTHSYSAPRYWVEERAGRQALLGKEPDKGQTLGYQSYRLAHRSIAHNTDERTMIAAVLPPRCFFGHSLNASTLGLQGEDLLFTTAVLNSFAFDFALRQRVSANLTMFFIYQMPVPRLTKSDAGYEPIVERAAKLICTTPEFDALATAAGLQGSQEGATNSTERARLRAELDGLIAHLYGLTEEEFAHVLATFPVVPDPVKVAAQNAYRDVARGLIR